jgi:hypothetical protein
MGHEQKISMLFLPPNLHARYELSPQHQAMKHNITPMVMAESSLVPRPSSLVGKIRERKAWENLSRD